MPDAKVTIDGKSVSLGPHAMFRKLLPTGTHMLQVSADNKENKSLGLLIETYKEAPASVTLDSSADVSMEYHSYYGMEDTMHKFDSNYSNIAKLYSIGRSAKSRQLLALKIDVDPEQTKAGRPSVVVIGGLGASDRGGKELAMSLARYLLSRYNHDAAVDAILRNAIVHIVPTLNPDSIAEVPKTTEKAGCNAAINTKNENGIELDENFVEKEKEGSIQPEVSAVQTWMTEKKFTLALVLRGGAEGVAVPYSSLHHSTFLTPDSEVFQRLGAVYSKEAKMPQDSSSCRNVQFVSGTTHDGVINPHGGSLLDCFYDHSETFALNVYYGCCGTPDEKTLGLLWRQHRPGLLKFLTLSTSGAMGYITDQANSPLPDAKITVKGSPFITTSKEHGAWWRPLPPGAHTITVQCEGYYEQTKYVDVMDGVTIMFKLKRDDRVAGLPRMVFVILAGSITLLLMVCCLCVATVRSTKQRKKTYGFHQLSQNIDIFNDSSTESDEETQIKIFNGNPKNKVKKKRASSRPYHDLVSSSSDEDDLFIKTSFTKKKSPR